MKTCTNKGCNMYGYPFSGGEKYCHKCGKKLDSYEQCPKCGYAVSPLDDYCSECGADLKVERDSNGMSEEEAEQNYLNRADLTHKEL